MGKLRKVKGGLTSLNYIAHKIKKTNALNKVFSEIDSKIF
jgi:hypothetical protein